MGLTASFPNVEHSCPGKTFLASITSNFIVIFCSLLSLFFGIGIGKVLGRREANGVSRYSDRRRSKQLAPPGEIVTTHDATACSTSTSDQAPIESQDGDPGILLLPPAFETGYESTIEDAKEVLLSIIGLPGYDEGPYAAKPWALVRCGSASYLWASHATSDGILIRSSCFANITAKSILKYIIDKDVVTGVEGIADRSEVIKTLHGGSITIRRICCKSGSFTSAKRDFTLITSNSVLQDGTYVVASRSIYVPETISALQRKSKNGFIRGIIYGAGYVLRPVRTAEGEGCEVFYAVHLDMLGSPHGRVNAAKTEELSSAVIDVMEKINQGCLQSPIRGLLTDPQSQYGDASGGGTQATTRYRAGSLLPTPRSDISLAGFSPQTPSTRKRSQSNASAFFPSSGSESYSSTAAPAVAPLITTRGKINFSANQIAGLRTRASSAKGRIRQLYQSFSNHRVIRDASSSLLTRTKKAQSMSSEDILSLSDDGFKAISETSEFADSFRSPKSTRLAGGSISNTAMMNSAKLSTRTAGENLQIATAAAKVIDSDRELQRSVRSMSDTFGQNRSPTPVSLPAPTSSMEAEKNAHLWDTFFHQDDIVISELQHGSAPVGVLSAQCSIEAPPSKVREILINQMEAFDSLLSKRCILNELDEKTHLQWLAYSSIWPVGARDFLVVTTDEPFDTADGSFLIVSSSVDDLCEEVDDIDNAIERIIGQEDGDGGYSRSCLRLAGYIGRPNIRGGVDLTLFLDVDAYAYTPAWLLQLLSQFGLCEMMDRIRCVATEEARDVNYSPFNSSTDIPGGANSSRPSTPQSLPQMVSRIQAKDARMRGVRAREQDDDTKSVTSQDSKSAPAVARSSRGAKAEPKRCDERRFSTLKASPLDSTDNRLLTGKFAPLVGRMPSAVAEKNAPLPIIKESYFDDQNTAVGKPLVRRRSHLISAEEAKAASLNARNAPENVPSPVPMEDKPGEFIQRGKELARASFTKMKIYLGLLKQPANEPPLGLVWQVKINKKNMTVESTMVNESAWQAVRAVTFVKSNKEAVLKLVTDDSRMAQFDDMFDFAKPLVKVDERTAIRRLCFKGIWPTLPRDFIVCTGWTELEDGSLLVCSCSGPDSLCAPAKGYVRGFIQISGYWIQPVETLAANDPMRIECGSAGGCRVTLTAHTELGGTLPASVINMLSTAAPMKILTAVGDIVAKER